jgi:hypothetical protein
MNHLHHHHGCDHLQIRHCNICDVTYCVNCKKEWGVRSYSFNYYNGLQNAGGGGGSYQVGYNGLGSGHSH